MTTWTAEEIDEEIQKYIKTTPRTSREQDVYIIESWLEHLKLKHNLIDYVVTARKDTPDHMWVSIQLKGDKVRTYAYYLKGVPTASNEDDPIDAYDRAMRGI